MRQGYNMLHPRGTTAVPLEFVEQLPYPLVFGKVGVGQHNRVT